MEAIERVKGYCCEVTQEQWAELVRVADEVGCVVGSESRKDGASRTYRFAEHILGMLALSKGVFENQIPFPDFLAKLKGEEQWQPKAGEMVEVSDCRLIQWIKAEYIALSRDLHVVWCEGDDGDDVVFFEECRPLRPTLTLAEAEAKLNCKIIVP
jgi:hypothetical protein